MEKLEEVYGLMQKLCSLNYSQNDFKDLPIDDIDKQRIVDAIDSAHCNNELDRIKEIMRKVESGGTLFQGGRK